MLLELSVLAWPPWSITFIAALGVLAYWMSGRLRGYGDGVPLVNRKYALEPNFFSRMRWATNATEILEQAHAKYGNQPFRLIRGDTDVLVMPVDFIPEMNKVPVAILNPRHGHMQTLTGHLTGLEAIKRTDRHVKLILSRLTPNIPNVWKPLCERVEKKMQQVLPQGTDTWVHLDPVEMSAQCVAEAMNLFLFGQPTCDDAEIAQLSTRVSKAVFMTMFIGRLLPPTLQKLLIWLSPQKWHLEAVWKDVERLLYPEFDKRREKIGDLDGHDLLSSMLMDGGFSEGADENHVLSRVIGVVQTGSTFSVSAVIASALVNLAAHPPDLRAIREEIRNKHIEISGRWDQAAFDSLLKLDSALKEAARVVPASILSYARKSLEPYTFSSGLTIRKDQTIAVSAWPRIMDPDVFPEPEKFFALREYNRDPDQHRATPFRDSETQELRWGTGRWACPGRYIASVTAKILLVKAVDEYDLRVVANKIPQRKVLHEFAFLDPSIKIAVRRRKQNSGISYS